MNITEKDLEGLTDIQKLFIKILLEMKGKDEEKVCEVLGTGLSDLITHNPKLIKVINDVYNTNKK